MEIIVNECHTSSEVGCDECGALPTHTTLPAEVFDRLVAELDRPPQVNPKFLAAVRKARPVRHIGE